ncbi:MAG: tetratricopeptide repeat protein, partial [Polaribacter sp.]
MKKILFLLLLVTQIFYAQDEQKIFNSANEMYKQQNYEKAIEFYKTLESNHLVSSELFYNLGNAHYKLNQVGPAIFYYEKALQIDPDNEDVKNNLVFAKRLALDTIEELPKTFFQKIKINYIQKLSYNEWAIVVVSFAILGSILFLLFYFSNRPGTKRFFFVISMLSYLFLIIA